MTSRALLFTLLAAGAAAQTVDRTKPPETPPLAPYKLPAIRESKLENGLTIMQVEDKRLPLVTVRLVFPAGDRYDPPDLLGLAETVASLIGEGTAKRSSRQIAEEMAEMGGSINASTGPDAFTISGFTLAEYTDKWLEIAADVARNASFPQGEVDLRKQNRVQELELQLAQSSVLADVKLREVVFGKHPYSFTLPKPEMIRSIKRADLLSFRDRHLNPGAATLILVGALPAEKPLMDAVRAHFGSWAAKPVPAAPGGELPKPTRSITLVDRPGSAQVDIQAGHLTFNRLNPDFFPFIVGNTILGGGVSSRMFVNIREKQGFAYQANSIHQPLKDSGIFYTVTQVREEVLEPALKALFFEMDRMGKEPVTAQELTNVKNYLNGFFVMGLSSLDGVAGQIASLRVNGVPLDYLAQYVTRVRSVEPEQIQRAAAKYMSPSEASIVIVGDASKILTAVEKFGKVTVEKGK